MLDEVYDFKIRPIVRSVIERADRVHLFGAKKKYKVFTLSVFYKESGILVIAAAKEKNLEALANGIERLPRIHEAANQFLQQGSYEQEVHLYILSGGKVNVEPYVYENIEFANRQINT